MRYIIRATDHGRRLPVDEVERKALEVKEKVLESGRRYLEFQATLGQYDPLGKRIEEQVVVIDEVDRDVYV